MNAIMTDFDRHRTGQPVPRNWEGFSEIDQAIRDNRLTEYRIRKAWADPWSRKLTIGVVSVIVLGFSFLVGATFGLWSRAVQETAIPWPHRQPPDWLLAPLW